MNIKDIFFKKANLIAVGILGTISLLYIILGVKFAETNLQLPFLNFPIFVGEIALFFSVIFFLSYISYAKRLTGNRTFDTFVILYFIFVLVKAIYGFMHYGPLALRHSALFYYPLTALIVYCSLIRFTSWAAVFKGLLPVILVLFLLQRFSEYWFLAFAALALAGILQFRNKKVRFTLGAALVLLMPYKMFFLTSRMMIVGNMAGTLFLMACSYVFLNWSRKVKLLFLGLITVVVIAGLVKTNIFTSAASIINFKEIINVFKEYDQHIQSQKPRFVSSLSKEVRLYMPNFNRKGIDEAETRILLKSIEKEVDSIVKDSADQDKETPEETVLPKLSDDLVSRIYYYDDYLNGLASQVINGTQPLTHTELKNVSELGQKIDVIYEKNLELAQVAAKSKDEVPLVYKNYVMVTQKIDNMRTNINTVKSHYEEEEQKDTLLDKEVVIPPDIRNENVAVVNAVFRLFIWRDIFEELLHFKPLVGFSFGRPLRSISLEICGWGIGEWGRDGWVEAHNSYFNVIYRAGVLGFGLVLFFLWSVINLILSFIRHRDFVGILLTSVLVNWMVAANFLPILELPYHSIPIWFMVGLAFAYHRRMISTINKEENE